jgi:hypothetical protein
MPTGIKASCVGIGFEGNCGERGTKQDNQTLGRRGSANAQKDLTDIGVSAQRT